MKIKKRNLSELVARNKSNKHENESIYAKLMYRFSPIKLQAYLDSLSEEEKAEYQAYRESEEGMSEQKEYERREKEAAKTRERNRKKKVFIERLTKIKYKINQSEELRHRLTKANTLTLNEIAESLILFPELLPAGHKAPSLTLARKHFKSILLDEEKEYLMYTWTATTIPVELCYTEIKQPYSGNFSLSC